MFDEIRIRYILALVWLLLFIGLWSLFQISLPYNTMKSQLDEIEKNIGNNDWEKINEYTTKFNDTYNKKHYLIKMNNSTEALTNFEHTIGQLTASAKHNSESTLEYAGALREMLKFVVKPFSGP